MDSRTYGLALAALKAGVGLYCTYPSSEPAQFTPDRGTLNDADFAKICTLDRDAIQTDTTKWAWFATPLDAYAAVAEVLGLSPIYPTEGMVMVSADQVQTLTNTIGYVWGQLQEVRRRHPDDPAWSAIANDFTWNILPTVAALSGTPQGDEYLRSPGWQRQLAEAEADVQAGRVHKVDSAEDLLRELNNDEPSQEVKD